MRNHLDGFIYGTAIFAANVVPFYIIFVYVPTNLVMMQKVSINIILWMNAIGLFLVLICAPLFGILSDKYGKRLILLTGALATIAFVFPLFYLYTLNSIAYYFFAQISFGILAAWYVASLPLTVAKLFPTELRFSGVSLIINMATCFLGGTAPIIVAFFVQKSGWYFTPLYILIFAIISLFFIIQMKKKQ